MDWFLNLVTAPWRFAKRVARGFMALSLASRIAWATLVFLTFFVLLTLCALLLSGGTGWTTLQAWWSPGKGLFVGALVIVVSVLVYYAARLWLQRENSRFPDIDAAWNAALGEMERQQIDLRNSPLFLVLGCDGQEQERAIIGEAPVQFLVTASPAGSAPLHAHAGHDGVFVCLSSIGQSCLLADMLRSILATSRSTAALSTAPLLPLTAGAGLGGLSSSQRDEATDRLTAICEHIRASRSPLAPVNGILSLVPFSPEDDALATCKTMGQAICEDVMTVTKAFGLRVPLTVAFTDLDKMEGFPELIKHLPAVDRLKAVGQSFPPSLSATADQLATVSAVTCGRLAELVAGKLGNAGSANQLLVNRKFIALMARIRLTMIARINAVLDNALNFSAPGAGSPMLAGCYVMATDAMADRRAFVRGMFDRMLAVQAELDWTPAKVSADVWSRRMAGILKIVNVALVLGIIGIILWRSMK
jgi:hypothetical protein